MGDWVTISLPGDRRRHTRTGGATYASVRFQQPLSPRPRNWRSRNSAAPVLVLSNADDHAQKARFADGHR
jgi:hypothetical protein